MIDPELLKELMTVTPEEEAILKGQGDIDRSLYIEKGGSVINANKLLERGKLITIRPHTRFVHFPKHSHDYVEVVYMCKGTTTHIVNGETVRLKQGELLFLGQNATQEILPAGRDDVAVNFIILPPFFQKSLEMLGEEETPLRKFLLGNLLKTEHPHYLHFRVADVLPVQNLVENLIWTLLNRTPNKRNIHQITMGLLIMQLLSCTDRLVYRSREEEAMVQVFRYIEENYREGSLDEVARLLHYDYFWLSHQIRSRTGKTYTELVQEKRLSQAAYLLKNTANGIEDIAAAVGYVNKSYFYRIFTSMYGMSPKKYRMGESRETGT